MLKMTRFVYVIQEILFCSNKTDRNLSILFFSSEQFVLLLLSSFNIFSLKAGVIAYSLTEIAYMKKIIYFKTKHPEICSTLEMNFKKSEH